MNDSYYIGAYWSARAEALQMITMKIKLTLESLKLIDEQFIEWYETGTSYIGSLKKLDLNDASRIEKLCLEKVKKTELDERGIAKMGFLFSLWSGNQIEEEASSISFNVGKSNARLINSCVLKFPHSGIARDRLLEIALSKRIVEKLVEIWSPDYAVLISDKLRSDIGFGNKLGPITYQKLIKSVPKIGQNVLYEKFNEGHLFSISNKIDNYFLVQDLEPIKNVISV